LVATGTVTAFSIGLAAMPAQADTVRAHEWWLKSLGVTGAWATSQGSGVTVAVLSDGVDQKQRDLTGAVTAAPALPGAPVATGRYLGETGTPIASLIAGRGHGSGSSEGIIGVAPLAGILSVRVTLPANDPALSSDASAIPAAIAAGIRYAVSHGAKVIDLPIDPGQPGASGTGGAAAAVGGSSAEQDAVAYALQHNVVLVAPAGDDATSTDAPNFPAAYHGVIAVGAFNSAFIKSSWSSHQSYVAVTAAGAGVRAAANNGQYLTMNSTSAASAMVSGIAALIRSRFPGLSAAAVRTALIRSTVFRPQHGLSDGSGYGTVNAEKALAAASALATPTGQEAGRDVRPLVGPAAIPASSATSSLESQVVKAGEESGAVLAILLLLIAVYAVIGRRRRRPRPVVPAAGAEWAHRQALSRYPQARGSAADRMLEAFAAPLAAPAIAGGPARAALPAGSGGAAPGVFAPTGGRPDAALAIDDGTLETGRVLTHGPASRAVNRRPAVSGAPPWEPATPPKSELPWTAGPSPESGLGWTAPERQRELPAASASPGVAAFFKPGEPVEAGTGRPLRPADSGSHSLFLPAEPVGADSDLFFRPGVEPGRQEPAGDLRQAWQRDETSRPSIAASRGESWAGHSSPAQAADEGGPWHGGEVGGSWTHPGASQIHDQPGEPWADRAGQYRASQPADFTWGEVPPGESRGRPDMPAEAWRAGSWQAEQPTESWSGQQPTESWSGQQPTESWSGQQPTESWSGLQPDQSWGGQPASVSDASQAWTSGDLQQESDGPVPARPGQHRIAPSGLPVRQPRATQQAAPLSPSGSLWERAERGGSLWERAESKPADEGRNWE
jgi:Subtilase family